MHFLLMLDLDSHINEMGFISRGLEDDGYEKVSGFAFVRRLNSHFDETGIISRHFDFKEDIT